MEKEKMRKVDKDERVDKGGAIYERIKRKKFFGKAFFSKETFMTQGDTHEHENNKVFSYQKVLFKKRFYLCRKSFY
jgi:hypothetical protein